MLACRLPHSLMTPASIITFVGPVDEKIRTVVGSRIVAILNLR
jgi:hypothetical protein